MNEVNTGPAPVWFPDWPAPDRVLALATLRGCGQGVYGGFNLALHVADEPARVISNRQWLRGHCAGLPLQWLQQVHGTEVFRVDAVAAESLHHQRPDTRCADATFYPSHDTPCADAVYTNQTGIALAILTADCLPVLLCDDLGGEVAAVHAGWRGLAAGIVNQAVSGFAAAPSRLIAWLGPAICAQHFEVGAEVCEAFVQSQAFCGEQVQVRAAFYPSARPGHYHCDLYALARLCLQCLGIERIHGGDCCTYHQPERFYSYRREPVCGRMATVIALR